MPGAGKGKRWTEDSWGGGEVKREIAAPVLARYLELKQALYGDEQRTCAMKT